MPSALVSTVHGSYDFSDQLPEGGRFVMVFPTEQDASDAAVAMLVEVHQVSRYHGGGWLFDGQHYNSPQELLSDWQEGLASSEYFHVLPVAERQPAEAQQSCGQA